MDIKNKEDRKKNVLEHIVCSYVHTSTPVSSKTVSQDIEGRVSSATVRNIMAELERDGYIEQPHTSAGRVPTSRGYRKYVEEIKIHIQFEKNEAQRLAAEYDRHINTLKEVIEKTSFLISRQLQNAGVVMWPSINDLYLKHIELIKIKAETVLAILVTMTNAVKNYIVELEKDLEKTDLEKIANYINANYEHTNLSDISYRLSIVKDGEFVEENEEEIRGIKRSAMGIIDAIFKSNVENEMCCDGLDHVINEPTFHDQNIAKNLMKMLSAPKDIARIMRGELPDNGLRVYIGDESGTEALKECSIITCGYDLYGKTAGRLGVIGPMRMDYRRALGTITSLAEIISAKLEEIDK
ncbi:MAG: heat-inducible transcriptional repressor HrcA [Candidatus Omnitrophota bacterium]